MHTIDLIGPHGEEQHFAFAGDWGELTELQLGQVAAELISGYTEIALRFRLLRLLAAIPKRTFLRIKYFSDLITATPDKAVVLPQLDWLLAPPVFHKSIVPHFTVGEQRFAGPDNDLDNFSIVQLSFADICLSAFIEHSTGENLNNILGALYVPEGRTWNHRDIEARGAQLASLPLHRKLGAVLNYRGLRNTLPIRYRRTFSGKGSSDDFGIDGLVVGIAGEKFGKVTEAGTMPLHPVLVHCETMRIRDEEIKAQAKKTA
jgi:hypothetical protein